MLKLLHAKTNKTQTVLKFDLKINIYIYIKIKDAELSGLG